MKLTKLLENSVTSVSEVDIRRDLRSRRPSAANKGLCVSVPYVAYVCVDIHVTVLKEKTVH